VLGGTHVAVNDPSVYISDREGLIGGEGGIRSRRIRSLQRFSPVFRSLKSLETLEA
jgi:hypothetical protein